MAPDDKFHFKHAARSEFGDGNHTWSIAFCPFSMYGDYASSSAARSASASSSAEDDGNHNNKPVYHCFATCGGKRIRLYDYLATSNTAEHLGTQPAAAASRTSSSQQDDNVFHLKGVYETLYEEEFYWNLAFGKRREYPKQPKEEQQIILCAGGKGGVIDIYNVQSRNNVYEGERVETLTGSTLAIHDLKVCPVRDDGIGNQTHNLLCSASDQELRVWNLDSFACICIFGGPQDGHLRDGSCVAWHPLGTKIVSGGKKDGRIFVWNVMKASEKSQPHSYPLSKPMDKAIQASCQPLCLYEAFGEAPFRTQITPKIQRFAHSEHNDVHPDGVDCVQWIGEDEEKALILSKSFTSNEDGRNEVILWKPIPRPPPGGRVNDETVANTTPWSELDPSVRDQVLQYLSCCSLEKLEAYKRATGLDLIEWQPYCVRSSELMVRFPYPTNDKTTRELRFDTTWNMENASSTLAVATHEGKILLWNLDKLKGIKEDEPKFCQELDTSDIRFPSSAQDLEYEALPAGAASMDEMEDDDSSQMDIETDEDDDDDSDNDDDDDKGNDNARTKHVDGATSEIETHDDNQHSIDGFFIAKSPAEKKSVSKATKGTGSTTAPGTTRNAMATEPTTNATGHDESHRKSSRGTAGDPVELLDSDDDDDDNKGSQSQSNQPEKSEQCEDETNIKVGVASAALSQDSDLAHSDDDTPPARASTPSSLSAWSLQELHRTAVAVMGLPLATIREFHDMLESDNDYSHPHSTLHLSREQFLQYKEQFYAVWKPQQSEKEKSMPPKQATSSANSTTTGENPSRTGNSTEDAIMLFSDSDSDDMVSTNNAPPQTTAPTLPSSSANNVDVDQDSAGEENATESVIDSAISQSLATNATTPLASVQTSSPHQDQSDEDKKMPAKKLPPSKRKRKKMLPSRKGKRKQAPSNDAKGGNIILQAVFSPDGNTIVAVDALSYIFQWQRRSTLGEENDSRIAASSVAAASGDSNNQRSIVKNRGPDEMPFDSMELSL